MFCCKHKSHKKHVLVCEEHKPLKENTDLLEEYKAKCILNLNKKEKLPEFSRQINFHSNSELYHTAEDISTNDNFDQPDVLNKVFMFCRL